MQTTIITEREDALETVLGKIRDLFPMPKTAEMHALWSAAMTEPESVLPYVAACISTTVPRAPSDSTDAMRLAGAEAFLAADGTSITDGQVALIYKAMRAAAPVDDREPDAWGMRCQDGDDNWQPWITITKAVAQAHLEAPRPGLQIGKLFARP